MKFTTKGFILLKVSYLDQNIYRISVTDSGVGIKPESISCLFKQFSKIMDTQNMNQQGVGLGLAISNTLAKMLSPNETGIIVESEYGAGAKFYFDVESKFNDEWDYSLSEDDKDMSKTVLKNMESFNEKSVSAQCKKTRVLQKWNTQKTGFSSMILPTMFEKDDLSSCNVQFNSQRSNDYQLIINKEPKSNNILGIPSLNPSLHNKINTHLSIPKSVTSLTSIDEKQAQKVHSRIGSYCLFEESEFVKKMDEKDKEIYTISKKLTSESEEPFILVIDDNAFNIIALRKILEGLNFKIDSATSGDAGIQKVLERNEKHNSNQFNYKLIFMDCNMPSKDGYETTREIRELGERGIIPKIPIIAVSALSHPREIHKCYEVGMDDYLAKPVNISALKSILTKYIKYTK